MILGIILMGIGFGWSEWIFYLPGTILILAGFFLTGHLKRVILDPTTRTISIQRGFFFPFKRTNLKFDQVTAVILKQSAGSNMGCSNSSNQTYEQHLSVSYSVEVQLDSGGAAIINSSTEQDSARRWANEVAELLGKELVSEV